MDQCKHVIVVDDCAHSIVTTDPLFLNASVTCAPATVVRADATNALHVEAPIGTHVDMLAAISDPALYAAQALRSALHHGGIEVRGTLRVNTTPRAWRERVATIESP